MEGVFSSIEISGSGMSVQRRKMNVVAENIANVETTSTPEGGPYRRHGLEVTSDSEKVPFRTLLNTSQSELARTNERHMSGPPDGSRRYETFMRAESEETTAGEGAYRLIYDPSHPDAGEDGYVKMPDIEIVNEMVDMISANRAYEANAMAVSTAKEMLKDALEI